LHVADLESFSGGSEVSSELLQNISAIRQAVQHA
jgi:hypothetical protein